jgi:hypothetical protein
VPSASAHFGTGFFGLGHRSNSTNECAAFVAAGGPF